MIPVTQTRIGRPHGNCTEACIASVLEVGIDAVPDLYDPDHEWGSPDFRKAQFLRLHTWLLEVHGLKYVQILAPPRRALPVFAELLEDAFFTTHHLLMGYNPDGVGHCTVGLAGRMVWDPNPLRRGIVDADEVVYLLPADMFLERHRDWPGLALAPAEVPDAG